MPAALIIGMGKGHGMESDDSSDSDAKADKAKRGQAQAILDAVKAGDADKLTSALSTFVQLAGGESEPDSGDETPD